MSVTTAVGILLLIVVSVDLALTAGIIRRLRNLGDVGVAGRPLTNPPSGHRVDLGIDGWPEAAADMLVGPVLVAFVLPGCMGCERLHREVDSVGGLPVPLYLVGEPFLNEDGAVERYLES